MSVAQAPGSIMEPGDTPAATATLRRANDQSTRELFQAATAARAGQPNAPERFTACRRTVERLLVTEERVLLPLLESQAADTTGLRRDRSAIAEALERAQRQLDRCAVDSFCSVVHELMLALTAHCIREERLLNAHAAAISASADARLLAQLDW
jgi:hypothetical protein